MKPTLVIGLGNPLMGDDGVGWRVAQQLARHPALPDSAEVIEGGTDLLRLGAQMEGRKRIVLIDAMQSAESPGSVRVFDQALPDGPPSGHCHHLSVVDAVQLLRTVVDAPIVLMTVSISSAAMGRELSTAVSACLPSILNRALELAQTANSCASISDSPVL